MNYLAIFMLVIVVFFLLKKNQLVKYDEKKLSSKELELMKYIKNNIVYINTNNKTISEIATNIQDLDCEYVMLTKRGRLKPEDENTIIYNFVLNNEKSCGFNVEFYCDNSKNKFRNVLNKLIVACVNYIQMLRKEDISTYYYVCLKKSERLVRNLDVQIFEISPNLKERLNEIKLKEYLLKRNKLRFSNILSFFFMILAGAIVTANVLYNLNAVIVFDASIYNVIACALIYVCYANILGKVYSPMGKYRFIASYLFPVYTVVYIVLTAYYYIKRIMGGMIMNKKKNFFISLVILLVIYVIFILIKR